MNHARRQEAWEGYYKQYDIFGRPIKQDYHNDDEHERCKQYLGKEQLRESK